MRTLIKIVLVNLLLIAFLFCGLEAYSYKKLVSKNAELLEQFNSVISSKKSSKVCMRYQAVTRFDYKAELNTLRNVEYRKSNKKPIIIFGCSFAYGYGLDDNAIFSYKLANITNRTVYNRARPGTGTSFMYRQLLDPEIKKQIPDAEYIIYPMIFDHFKRLFLFRMTDFDTRLMLRYKINKNNELEEEKCLFPPLESLFTTIVVENYISEKSESIEQASILFNKLMDASIKISKKKYPNSKFVVLIIKDPSCDNYQEQFKQYQPIFKVLKKKGVIVIEDSELIGNKCLGKEYYIADRYHPSEKFWDEVTPKLAARLKL